jgi:hypothetical protein
MPKKQTKASRYPSRYSPDNFVTEAQYVTELICEKKATTEKKELPIKFWNLPEWAKFYRQQIAAANSLLQNYPCKAIVAALNSKKAWNIYSLRAPHLIAMIVEAESHLKTIDVKEETVEIDTNSKPRPSTPNKKNMLNRLRELE